MPLHVVKHGECLSTIAENYGLFWETIWNDEKNAALRERRRDPNVLMAGDRVYVREKAGKDESGITGQAHTFRLKGIPVKLRIRILDEFNQPRKGLKYKLTVDGEVQSGTIPDDGLLTRIIRPLAKKATIRLETGEEWVLNLGQMNPIDYTSGVQARLKNLGFYSGRIDAQMGEETQKALRKFQRHHGLPETGKADASTQAALLVSHES